MASSLRLKKTHVPDLWVDIKPARNKIDKWDDTVDCDKPERRLIWLAEAPNSTGYSE